MGSMDVVAGSSVKWKLLALALLLDGLIAIAFGSVSWVAPYATYGTIVDLSGTDASSLVLSALASLSALYVVVGVVAVCGAAMPAPHRQRIAAVMMLRHLSSGLKGLAETNRVWLVGDPWTDLYIHGFFVLSYVGLLFLCWRAPQR